MREISAWLVFAIFAALLTAAGAASGFAPSAPTNITVSSVAAPEPSVGYVMNNSGGTITTLVINATTQNYRWKGFVGNITGEFALMDSSMSSIYSWPIDSVMGEVYATRSPGAVDWSNIACSGSLMVEAEQADLNVTNSSVDSIINTFDTYLHDSFYVGPKLIGANSCRATALNVNNSRQSTYFQEVLLTDGENLVYGSLLENRIAGFNNQSYDFQMIVAENALPGEQANTEYYFYVELI